MIRRVTNFVHVKKEWFGEGGEPAPIEQAQARADICTGRLSGKPCPKHYKGSWLWNIVTAIAINAQMELRRIMNIKLQGDDQLNVCEVCGCPLRLKVHVPFKHIYRNTTPQELAKFPPNCWKTIEAQQIK